MQAYNYKKMEKQTVTSSSLRKLGPKGGSYLPLSSLRQSRELKLNRIIELAKK
jgi:hypothetical protein